MILNKAARTLSTAFVMVMVAGMLSVSAFAENPQDEKRERFDHSAGTYYHTGERENEGRRGDHAFDRFDRDRYDNRRVASHDYDRNDQRIAHRGDYHDRDNYHDYGYHAGNRSDNRQETKNDWRNLAAGAGGIAAYGLLKHDSTLTVLGAAGALYSLHRYDQDRKSQH